MSEPPPRPLDLADPAFRADPYPAYAWYREQAPVHRLEPPDAKSVPRFLLTRWEDVAAGLKNPVLKREVHSSALWNQPLEELPPALRTYARITREWPLFRDPPRHAPLRRPIHRVLDQVQENSAFLSRIVRRVLDDLAARASFDAAEDFARRVVLQLNLEMLGLADRDWGEFAEHLQNISLGLGNVFQPERLEKASGSMEIIEHWMIAAAEKRRNAREQSPAPLLDRLLSLEADGVIAGRAQLAATAMLLAQAGQDTTSALLASGIWLLLRHSGVVEKLIAERDFALRLVEEVLRYESPVQQLTRHASEALEIRGVTVAKGDGVSFLLGAANRDPRVFENPERFDPAVARRGTAAFGFGPHACPGASFGRETVGAALRELFTRFPGLRLTSNTIAWKPLVTFRSLAELPVTPS